MNITFLTRLYHPHIGGVERHVEKLGQVLVHRGHQVTVITTQYETSLNLEDTINGIRILRIPRANSESKLSLWNWISKRKKLLQTADVIHVHDVFWWLFALRPFLKTPIYTTFHGWEGVFPPSSKAKIIRKLSEKLSLGNICVGDFISTWYGTTPNLVTYGATDLQPLEPGSKDRILVFGRLSRDNDISLAIYALKIIKQKLPQIKVTFLGDGELAWEAEKIGKVLGFQENPEKYLQKAHWVISSSYLSMLDAMATGRQVISLYSNPLKKDYICQHPMSKLIIKASDTASLVDQFTLSYMQHTTSIAATQAWALAQTWDKLADAYLKLWNQDYTVAMKTFNSEI